MRDADFKKLLVSSPHTAIEQELGIPVPESINIKVLESTENTEYIVLPPPEAVVGEADVRPTGITWSSASNGCSC
jgi:hypothetical protein